MGREYERQELGKVEPVRSTEGPEQELRFRITAAVEEAQRRGPHYAPIVDGLLAVKNLLADLERSEPRG